MKKWQKEYSTKGYTRINLDQVDSLRNTKERLQRELQKFCSNKKVRIDNLHLYFLDQDIEEVCWKLCQFFWKMKFCKKIIKDNIDIFEKFIGPDIYYQTQPFLRISRPNNKSDNIGFHRDTMYGQSPYEVSVHVPLSSLDKNSCLKFLPGSHLLSDSHFEVAEKGSNASKKGSRKHEMGFPYDPKVIKETPDLKPVPLKFGQAVVFPPSTLHGQKINTGSKTRMSFDFRIISKYAPVKFRQDITSRGYSLLSESAITEVADNFLKINQQQ